MTVANALGPTFPASVGGTAATTITGAQNTFLLPQGSGRNLIIGGNFDTNPWQRGVLGLVSSGNPDFWLADMWSMHVSGTLTAEFEFERDTGAPTVSQSGMFTEHSIAIVVTTGQNLLDDADYTVLRTRVEDNVWDFVSGGTSTLSFWVKSNVSGIHCASLYVNTADKSYVAEYTIDNTATWEYKTITFPSSSGAAGHLHVNFCVASGSTYETTAGSWQTGLFYTTANQTNGIASNGDYFEVQLVQLEPGNVATPFELRDSGEELQLCMRYCEMSYKQGTQPQTDTETNISAAITSNRSAIYTYTDSGFVPYKVTKVFAPTVDIYTKAAGEGVGYWGWESTVAGPPDNRLTIVNQGVHGFLIRQDTQIAAGNIGFGHFIAKCEF